MGLILKKKEKVSNLSNQQTTETMKEEFEEEKWLKEIIKKQETSTDGLSAFNIRNAKYAYSQIKIIRKAIIEMEIDLKRLAEGIVRDFKYQSLMEKRVELSKKLQELGSIWSTHS